MIYFSSFQDLKYVGAAFVVHQSNTCDHTVIRVPYVPYVPYGRPKYPSHVILPFNADLRCARVMCREAAFDLGVRERRRGHNITHHII